MGQILTESNFKDVEVITESLETGDKKFFIEGIFMQSNVVNRNRRIYPSAIMENEIGRYKQDYVVKNRAIGELNHPKTTKVNPERASHIVESITQDGNNYMGRARILNTSVGKNVQALLEGGVQLGVSSRGNGKLKDTGRGIKEVQSDFKLAAIDIVYQPSAPDAFVSGLMENADFIWNTLEEDTEFLEAIKEDVHKTNKSNLNQKKYDVLQIFLDRVSK